MDNSFHRRDQAQGVRLAAATELWQRQDTNNNMRFAFSSFACMHRIHRIRAMGNPEVASFGDLRLAFSNDKSSF